MIIFIVNDFFMRIIITENQYTKLVEQVGVSCVPTGETEFNEVDVSFYDMVRNGSILNYGDYDLDKTHPIYVIQKKLGISRDGYYGKDMLKALSTKLNIDLCKQINNNIPLGPNALKKLGLYVDIPKDDEDYILASTLVGENQRAEIKELNAILSTIKNRADKCGYSMKDSVLKGKQYSTWNYFNRLDNEGKFEELHNRITNQKVKGFDKMLKIVEDFSDGDVIKVNHYVNPSIVDLSTGSTRTIAKSYNNNKKSAKKIGDHIFWWDKRHPC
tara:strand:- start:448 stop:1263 length:816 start_codon:yes stop_codon:yes gene_type:complete